MAALFHDGIESRTVNELHHVIPLSGLFTHSEDGHDISMVQTSSCLGFTLEAGHLVRIVHNFGRQQSKRRLLLFALALFSSLLFFTVQLP